MDKDINRIKGMLAEKKRITLDPATVSKWCTNAA